MKTLFSDPESLKKDIRDCGKALFKIVLALCIAVPATAIGIGLVNEADAARADSSKTNQIADLKSQLASAQNTIEQLNGRHEYEFRTVGITTWRFDKVTGTTCLLLAPDWYWKKNQSQSC